MSHSQPIDILDLRSLRGHSSKVMPAKTQNEVTFRHVVSEGKPAAQIVELADKEDVDLKCQFGSKIYLLHAIELTDVIRFGRQGHFKDAHGKLRAWAEDQLKNLTPHELLSDLTVHRILEEGSPGKAIVDWAEANDVDCVVLGTHGYGSIEKHFVGKASDKVLETLARPTLTVQI